MANLDSLLQSMWADYVRLTPQAGRIHDAFVAKGETVVNDHIALRTIQHPKLGLDQLGKVFEAAGYRKMSPYQFKEKKLLAYHYEHADETKPKIFISELLLSEFSASLQKILTRLIDSIPADAFAREDFCYLGRPWTLTSAEYLSLAEESEYASWVAAYGFRPNHFTVSVNHLKGFKTLAEVNDFVKSLGYRLNASGGEIKGSKTELLEQSSTMADASQVRFSDKELPVPSCYYEFALRYPLPNGKLYPGFVAASADKIFESTNRA